MFDHYLENQRPDTKRQKLLTATLFVSAVGTFVMVLFMWVAGKMAIARVSPPTISFIMVQMTQEEPPPPPPPPPPPQQQEEVQEEEIPEEEEAIEEEVVQPKEVKEEIPKPKSAGKVPKFGGLAGGIPGGMIGGMGQGGVARASTGQRTAKKPMKAVMAAALYAPDPPQKLLQQTKTGRFSKKPGLNKTTFCISASGSTVDVRTKKGFPGDPQVDQIIRNQVKKWRFKPFVVGGKPIKTCTEMEFQIRFQ